MRRHYLLYIKGLMAVACLLLASSSIADENEGIERLANVLRNFAKTNGRPPTDIDLFAVVLGADHAVKSKDLGTLYRIVKQQNSPALSRESLLNIVKAKRASISDFQCEYAGGDTYIDDPANSYSVECKYRLKGDMFFMDRSTKRQTGTFRDVMAYNGEDYYRLRPSSTDLPGTTVGVSSEIDPGAFEDYRLPLSNAMLMNSERYGLEFNFAHDLVQLLEWPSSMLCESTEIVDGEECVVLCSWYSRVWLSPTLNFSPVRYQEYEVVHHVADGGDRIVDMRLMEQRREFKGYNDYGNGVWLPTEVNMQFFNADSSDPYATSTTIASSIEVNSGLTKDSFTEFIPDGTVVFDIPRNLTYEWGGDTSIGHLVDGAVARKGQWTALWVVNLTAALLLFGTSWYRRRQRNKRGVQ